MGGVGRKGRGKVDRKAMQIWDEACTMADRKLSRRLTEDLLGDYMYIEHFTGLLVLTITCKSSFVLHLSLILTVH